MKVFLDDERPTPEGWVRVYWPSEAIALLETGHVTEISLDHDLGDDAKGTGYDVVLWIEEAVRLRGFVPPRMQAHSANTAARQRMEAGFEAIERAIMGEAHKSVAFSLKRLQQSLFELNSACVDLSDAARIHAPSADKEWLEFLAEVQSVEKACNSLGQSAKWIAWYWINYTDKTELAGMAQTPEQVTALRARIAQANQHLMALYPQLVALAQHAAKPLYQEWEAPQGATPLQDGCMHVELSYCLDEADPTYDDNADNILTEQEVLFWATGKHSSALFTSEEHAMRINDNWLDHRHTWMTHQCWLTHDVLEHNYGQSPLGGLAALLRVKDVYIDVHSVRSYTFDLQTGRFVEREKS